MKSSSVRHYVELLTCAAVAAGWLGCGGLEVETGAAPSEVTVCTTVSASAPWWNTAFPQQSERFHVELTATPSTNSLDAVIGLSQGAAASWTKLAAIVRFNAAGLVDVRSGDEYRADSVYAYRANTKYFIRFDVDLRAHTYSVWLKTFEYSNYMLLARDYRFRTEQATASALDHAAGYLEPDRPGSLELCDLSVVRDDTTADGCIIGAAGGGFANAQIDETTGAMIARFTAAPSATNIDAVVGFGAGAVGAYNDLAAAIRFWTNGRIEARDGDVYRADAPVSYVAGGRYDFRVIVDLPTKTYSVFVAAPSSPYSFIELARGYRFRPQQQAVTALDHGAAVVSSATGRVEVCQIRNTSPPSLSFAREGWYFTLPLSGGGALISGGARTQRLDAAGRTIAELPRGGVIAVDAAGNIYVASSSGSTLALSSFTSAMAPRWSRTYAAEGAVQAIGVYTTGEIAVAVGAQLIQIYSNGAEHLRINLAQFPAEAVALAPCGFAIAYQLGGNVVVEAHQPGGALLWRRSWAGSFTVDTMARDPAGGVVFAGTFHQTVDFGNGPFEPAYIPDGGSLNTYLVVLASDGSLRFSKHLYTTSPTSVASNGGRTVVATVLRTQMSYMELRVFDAGGAQVWSFGGIDSIEGLGASGPVAIGDTGRIYANLGPAFAPGPFPIRWPFLFAFDP